MGGKNIFRIIHKFHEVAYRMSVVLLRCPLVPEIMHGGATEGLNKARKSPYNLYFAT